LASIRHPNVVNFIGACHKPGQRCLVTEYCARGSLDQVLHKSGESTLGGCQCIMSFVRCDGALSARHNIGLYLDNSRADFQ
jgi:serine/threonine protein kinase